MAIVVEARQRILIVIAFSLATIFLFATMQQVMLANAYAETAIDIHTSFGGHNFESDDALLPDTNIAVNSDYIVEVVNFHVDIFSKSGSQLSSETLNAFFGASSSNFIFDPKVLYDPDSERWFVTSADSTDKVVRLAVSSSNNPTLDWQTYVIPTDNDCPDQPSIGLSSDKFVISLFISAGLHDDCSGGDTTGQQLFIFDKSDLTSGTILPLRQDVFLGSVPIVFPAKPSGSVTTDDIYLVSGHGTFYKLYTISGSVPDAKLEVNEFRIRLVSDPPRGVQPDGDSLDADIRGVQDAAYHGDKLWFARSEHCSTHDGERFTHHSCIRLVQIDTGSKTVEQDITYAPPVGTDYYFFYPALSIDGDGNLIVIYGFSSQTVYPSLAVTGRSTSDPQNTVRAHVPLIMGDTSANTDGWYGDAFGAATDPSDDSKIWVAGEYITSEFGPSVLWSTYIAKTSIGSSSTPPPIPPPAGCTNGLCSLTVNTEDAHGSVIRGYWTVLSQNGATVATGFTPATFNLNQGQNYAVSVADYGQYAFSHWKDTSSTVRARQVSLTAESSLTAIYRNINEPAPPPPSSPDFTISASPSSLQVTAGGSSQTSTISVGSTSGFSSQVSLAVSPSISGVTATLSPSAVTPASGGTASSTLTISATSGAAPGTYQLTVSGNSGSLSHSTSIPLTISSSTPPPNATPKLTVSTQDFSCGSISGYYTILRQNDGVISKGFTPATFTLNGGQQYAVEVQDYGAYAFDHWKDTQSTTRNRQVSIAADTIVTAIYKNLNNPSATGPCSISSPPSNDADFSISASPSAVTVLQAGSSSSTIAIASLNDFSSAVSLSASSISGVTATFSANPITPASNGQARSVLVISASPSAAPGIYQLTVTGSSGSLSHSTTMSITIGQQQKSTKINVNTADSAGNPIFGYYTTLWQNGNVVQTAFSPAEFAVNNGETYQVAVADYGSYVFDHWSDGSTDRFHSVIAGDSLTAVYRK